MYNDEDICVCRGCGYSSIQIVADYCEFCTHEWFLDKKDFYEEKSLIKKQKRIMKAEHKDCSNCEARQYHDPNDYMCIVCRDGPNALPSEMPVF